VRKLIVQHAAFGVLLVVLAATLFMFIHGGL
jgi:hypothetical protein